MIALFVKIVCNFRWPTHNPVLGNATVKLEIISVAANENFQPIIRKIDYVSFNAFQVKAIYNYCNR